MAGGGVDQLAFLKQVKELTDLEGDVLSQAVGCHLALREVLEDNAERSLEFIKDGLTDFDLFLNYTKVLG